MNEEQREIEQLCARARSCSDSAKRSVRVAAMITGFNIGLWLWNAWRVIVAESRTARMFPLFAASVCLMMAVRSAQHILEARRVYREIRETYEQIELERMARL